MNELKRYNEQITQILEAVINRGGTDQALTRPPTIPLPVLIQVNAWEDDPFSQAIPTANPPLATPVAAPILRNTNPRLQTSIIEPAPAAARYAPGTANFRYWATNEAVTRGIAFWSALLPAGTTWSTSNPMRIQLVAGIDLNAYYARNAGLRFFHQVVHNLDIYSCESPDVACHELGHAILDALKPQLFNAASIETGAFHESFGDMSGILCALQVQSERTKVIAETGGALNISSRLSRLAEQLGWGIRQLAPTAVDADCLRNAANRFMYRAPNTLPSSAPASQLSSEVHSFSRVFTGAFLEALAGMFRLSGAPTEASLHTVSHDMGQLLVDAIHAAPITTQYYSSVAAAMIQADRVRFGGKYGRALTSAFVGRAILSVHSALELANAPVPQPVPAAAGIADTGHGAAMILAYPGREPDQAYRLGVGETPELPTIAATLIPDMAVRMHSVEIDASELFGMSVVPATFGQGVATPLTAEHAANSFLEDLIQTGRLDMGGARGAVADLAHTDTSRTTHMLVPDAENPGAVVLKRKHFECGFCACAPRASQLACV